MEKFQLSVLFKIIGIGSASGLIYQDNLLYIISDNSTYLYEYDIQNEKLDRIPLVENPQENIAKKDKPDFESITSYDDNILLLGSGSTKNRNQSANYNTKSKKVTANGDFTDIFKEIKSELGLKDDELNIEGQIMTNSNFYFFQRGNGISGKNGIICGSKKNKYRFIPFELPKIKDVPATFTDAVLVGKTIYFLASAEDTTSTYLDGEVLGSIIGTIDLKTMKLLDYIQISDKNKFEGITFYKKTLTKIEFLLCEDNDSDVLETAIYKLTLSL